MRKNQRKRTSSEKQRRDNTLIQFLEGCSGRGKSIPCTHVHTMSVHIVITIHTRCANTEAQGIIQWRGRPYKYNPVALWQSLVLRLWGTTRRGAEGCGGSWWGVLLVLPPPRAAAASGVVVVVVVFASESALFESPLGLLSGDKQSFLQVQSYVLVLVVRRCIWIYVIRRIVLIVSRACEKRLTINDSDAVLFRCTQHTVPRAAESQKGRSEGTEPISDWQYPLYVRITMERKVRVVSLSGLRSAAGS